MRRNEDHKILISSGFQLQNSLQDYHHVLLKQSCRLANQRQCPNLTWVECLLSNFKQSCRSALVTRLDLRRMSTFKHYFLSIRISTSSYGICSLISFSIIRSKISSILSPENSDTASRYNACQIKHQKITSIYTWMACYIQYSLIFFWKQQFQIKLSFKNSFYILHVHIKFYIYLFYHRICFLYFLSTSFSYKTSKYFLSPTLTGNCF